MEMDEIEGKDCKCEWEKRKRFRGYVNVYGNFQENLI